MYGIVEITLAQKKIGISFLDLKRSNCVSSLAFATFKKIFIYNTVITKPTENYSAVVRMKWHNYVEALCELQGTIKLRAYCYCCHCHNAN